MASTSKYPNAVGDVCSVGQAVAVEGWPVGDFAVIDDATSFLEAVRLLRACGCGCGGGWSEAVDASDGVCAYVAAFEFASLTRSDEQALESADATSDAESHC